MSVIISTGEIRSFFNENKSTLKNEYCLVAEREDTGVEVYITEECGLPCFTVEVNGCVENEVRVTYETQIENDYFMVLNLYIYDDNDDEFLDAIDIERLEEIHSATLDYLSVLLECEPDGFFDDDCTEEIASAFEEYLYNTYGISVRHPIVDGNRVIQYPFSDEI